MTATALSDEVYDGLEDWLNACAYSITDLSSVACDRATVLYLRWDGPATTKNLSARYRSSAAAGDTFRSISEKSVEIEKYALETQRSPGLYSTQ